MSNDYYFPDPTINGSRGLVDLAQYGNTVTGNLFGLFLVIMIFLVFFITIRNRRPNEEAFVVAGFITALSSIFLYLMDLISESIVAGVLVIFFVSLLLLYIDKNR